MFKIQTHYKVVAIAFFVLALGFLSGGKAHAASITVNTDTNPSPCTLDEAIENINDQADTNTDCVETGTYGVDDTIIIPEGKVLLAADLPQIVKPINIVGAGMGLSSIDGNNGQYPGLDISTTGQVSLESFKVQSFKAFGILVWDANLNIQKVEIDGSNSIPSILPFSGTAKILGGMRYYTQNAVNSTVDISHFYIHDFSANDVSYMAGLSISAEHGSTVNSDVKNITVADVHSTDDENPQVFGISTGTNSGGQFVQNKISNATIHNITTITTTVSGALSNTVFNFGEGVRSSNQTLSNITIDGFEANSVLGDAGALWFGAAASSQSDNSNLSISASNVLFFNNKVAAQDANCKLFNANSFVNGSGVVNISLASSGGNFSDDNTCKDYFTQPTDQNNLTTLGSTLGPLSDNGGYVPTIPLLQGSPAIDAGVTVSGLTTDARLAVRPQGSAFDSGAYESPYTKAATSTTSLASTGQNTPIYSLIALLTILTSAVFLLTLKFKS